MPSHENVSDTTPTSSQTQKDSAPQPRSKNSSWTPQPIRILFSHFPLQTLPANRLPSRSLSAAARKKNTLFLFTTAAANDSNAHRIPSYNPTCLKWQAYLLTHGIEFGVRASSNHASPSGSLPFLIPGDAQGVKASLKEKNATSSRTSTGASVNGSSSSSTVAASAMQSWISSVTKTKGDFKDKEEDKDGDIGLRESSFLSLVDHRLRPAWLHCFYLTPNLHSLAAPLYIHTTTTSHLVRQWQTVQLRSAALSEVRKTYPLVEVKEKESDVLYAGASKALEALDGLLGDHEWFFGASQPGMLDATVFAYVHLILDEALGSSVGGKWDEKEESRRLRALVEQHGNLQRHRNRILESFYT